MQDHHEDHSDLHLGNPWGHSHRLRAKKRYRVTVSQRAQHQSSSKLHAPQPGFPVCLYPMTPPQISAQPRQQSGSPAPAPGSAFPLPGPSQPHHGTRRGPSGPWLGHGRRRVGRAHNGAQLCCADIHHTRLHSRCQMPGIWPCRSGSCGRAHGTRTLGRGERRAGQRPLEGSYPKGRGPQCYLRFLPQASILGWGLRDFKASFSTKRGSYPEQIVEEG